MQNHDRRSAAIYGLLAAAWVGVLFFFSGQSGEASGALSGRLTEILFGWLIDRGVSAGRLEFLLRKAAHMGIFAVEGFLLAMALGSALRKSRAALWSLPICAALAVANELHQRLPGGRTSSAADVLIDSFGALIGVLLAAVLLHALSSRASRKGKNDDTTGDAI
ncbi:MAG TPA: VanZ family protein [Candidatus Faecivicinus avistercoris]|nr:VanZ family protein [Candidatus Faecivicinus avistercoris]